MTEREDIESLNEALIKHPLSNDVYAIPKIIPDDDSDAFCWWCKMSNKNGIKAGKGSLLEISLGWTRDFIHRKCFFDIQTWFKEFRQYQELHNRFHV